MNDVLCISEAEYITGGKVDWRSIPRSKAFTECMKYFDTYDNATRSVLLSVNEADQNLIMQSLANKLYGYIISKVDDIDFGTIPNSKGNIEAVDHYTKMLDCIGILSQVLVTYHQPTDSIDVLNIAIHNILERRDMFMKAYRMNIEIPIIVYNTMVLSVTAAVSLLINAHIEYIKSTDNKGYDIAFDKASKVKPRERLLFKNLEQFNSSCTSGEFDKTMAYVIGGNVQLKEMALIEEGIEPGSTAGVAPASSDAISGGEWGAADAPGHYPLSIPVGFNNSANDPEIWKIGNPDANNPGIPTMDAVNGVMTEGVFDSVGGALKTVGNMLRTGKMGAVKFISNTVSNVAQFAMNHPVITGIGVAIVGLIALINLIRTLIYYFFYYRVKASDWLDEQSALLMMNGVNTADALTTDPNQKKHNMEMRTKIAKYATKLADKIRVQENIAEKEAEREIKKNDNDKFVYSDVIDGVPASASTNLF